MESPTSKRRTQWYHVDGQSSVLERVKTDHVIPTKYSNEYKRRRTVLIQRKKRSFGFTIQTYGIHHPRRNEIEVLTYIDYVEYGGPAYLAGVRPGDVILSINGSNLEYASHEELVEFIKTCGNYIRMVVLFEDCVRKVELHMRCLKLKQILADKVAEYKKLCEQEEEILKGRCNETIQQNALSTQKLDNWSITPEARVEILCRSTSTQNSDFSDTTDDSLRDVHSEPLIVRTKGIVAKEDKHNCKNTGKTRLIRRSVSEYGYPLGNHLSSNCYSNTSRSDISTSEMSTGELSDISWSSDVSDISYPVTDASISGASCSTLNSGICSGSRSEIDSPAELPTPEPFPRFLADRLWGKSKAVSEMNSPATPDKKGFSFVRETKSGPRTPTTPLKSLQLHINSIELKEALNRLRSSRPSPAYKPAYEIERPNSAPAFRFSKSKTKERFRDKKSPQLKLKGLADKQPYQIQRPAPRKATVNTANGDTSENASNDGYCQPETEDGQAGHQSPKNKTPTSQQKPSFYLNPGSSSLRSFDLGCCLKLGFNAVEKDEFKPSHFSSPKSSKREVTSEHCKNNSESSSIGICTSKPPLPSRSQKMQDTKSFSDSATSSGKSRHKKYEIPKAAKSEKRRNDHHGSPVCEDSAPSRDSWGNFANTYQLGSNSAFELSCHDVSSATNSDESSRSMSRSFSSTCEPTDDLQCTGHRPQDQVRSKTRGTTKPPVPPRPSTAPPAVKKKDAHHSHVIKTGHDDLVSDVNDSPDSWLHGKLSPVKRKHKMCIRLEKSQAHTVYKPTQSVQIHKTSKEMNKDSIEQWVKSQFDPTPNVISDDEVTHL